MWQLDVVGVRKENGRMWPHSQVGGHEVGRKHCLSQCCAAVACWEALRTAAQGAGLKAGVRGGMGRLRWGYCKCHQFLQPGLVTTGGTLAVYTIFGDKKTVR